MSLYRRWCRRLNTRSMIVQALLSWAMLVPAGVFFLWVVALPVAAFDRRQFMADCTTARGSNDAGFRACAADWPRHQLLQARHWRAP